MSYNNDGGSFMALIQVRVNDKLKEESSELFEKIGLDMSTAIRIFLAMSVNYGGIPFDLYADEKGKKGIRLLKEIQKESVKNGTSNMTLDEINEEIRLARLERKTK